MGMGTDAEAHSAPVRTDRAEPAGLNETVCDRRAVVRCGVKLAFVAPVLSTFFAHEARAAASGNQSCYPQGHVCRNNGTDPEPCCDGLTCTGNPGTCEP